MTSETIYIWSGRSLELGYNPSNQIYNSILSIEMLKTNSTMTNYISYLTT